MTRPDDDKREALIDEFRHFEWLIMRRDRDMGVDATRAAAAALAVGFVANSAREALAKRVEALEQQASVKAPSPQPAPTRPLQVGDRVRNAAGTDTGVVDLIDGDGDAGVTWDSGQDELETYNPITLRHFKNPSHPTYGHVVLLEPDFDTQAREAGYVKAEEVLRRLDDEGGMPYSSPMPLPELRDWLRAQAKGGAK